MHCRYGWTLVVLALLPLSLRADDPAKDDLKKMQGTWEFVRATSGGEDFPNDVMSKSKFTIKDDIITFESDTEKNSAKMKLGDGTTKPRTLDAEIQDGADKGKTRLAIYEVDGDTLKICWGKDKRPEKFASEKGETYLYMELKRKK